MTNGSIPVGGLVIILSCTAFYLLVQEYEPLQAEQDSLVNNIITNTTELLYNMNQHAKDLIDEGKYEQALQTLNETLSIDPNFTDAIKNKGDVYYDQGNYTEAIELYDRAIGIDPNYTDAINNKGNALSYLSQYDEAIKLYDRAIGIDPNDTLVMNNKGAALADLGKYDEAIQMYDRKSQRHFLNPEFLSVMNFCPLCSANSLKLLEELIQFQRRRWASMKSKEEQAK